MVTSDKAIYNYAFFAIVLVTSLYIYIIDAVYSDFKVLLTSFLILIFSLLFMIKGDSYNYSLNKIFMLFSFFFFGIAPVLQYRYGIVLWGGPSFSDYSYYRLNLIILGILLTYQGLYCLFSRLKSNRFSNFILEKNNEERKLSGTFLLFLSLISLLITFHFNNYNLVNLLFRAGGDIERFAVDQSINLIFGRFIRPIPVIALIIFKKSELRNKKLEIILIIIALVSNFPTSGARFYIASLYIPLLILYCKQINDKYMLLNKTLILGILVIFPLLDQARRINHFSDFKFSLDFQMFTQGHFDSYQMFMRVIDNNFITMGRQLLSVIFFFIPRSIWPNKSVGSGHLISKYLRLTYSNISMNFFGEGYINFGFIGILIFTIAIAFINAKFDKAYWQKLKNHSWLSTFYLLLLGSEFFILRGDLLSSFAYTMGIGLSVIFVYITSTKKTKTKG